YLPGNSQGGKIPVCGGSSQYAGNYVGVWNLGPFGNGCYLNSFNDTITIDSGGILFDQNNALTGYIYPNGTGIGDVSEGNSYGGYEFTITDTVKNANGNWVISGSGLGYTGSSNCGTFVLTQM
ncbi:MAG TPA: hypothetical protein V6C65_09100, partial [Allocoleopsis sp.]